MHNLFLFLLRYSTAILFIIYMVISGVLLVGNNPYQHYVYLSSANTLSAGVYKGVNSVTSYFNLRDINDDLQRRNAELELEVLTLKKKISDYNDAEYALSLAADTTISQYTFVIAHVINNSISRSRNYVTLDKGRLDGITRDMGVVDQNGVVGAVDLVSDHAARVISVLNPDFSVSCKVKGSNHPGLLRWDGEDYTEAVLYDLPKHAVYHKGDTIVTSGYSGFFPKDVPVGTVISDADGEGTGQMTLRVKLFTDFSTLSTVRVIGDRLNAEIRAVEDIEGASSESKK